MKINFGLFLFFVCNSPFRSRGIKFSNRKKNPKKWLESLTYNQSQDIEFYKNIKSGTKLGEYITSNGNSLIIGAPTSSIKCRSANLVARICYSDWKIFKLSNICHYSIGSACKLVLFWELKWYTPSIFIHGRKVIVIES